MNGHDFNLAGARLTALPSGALWWADQRILTVSDLHLGKSDRMARRGGLMLPPYETRDALQRLDSDIGNTAPQTVVCLGDSFDDLDAIFCLSEDERQWITRLQAGRRWIWIEGNHDPGPTGLGGTHLSQLNASPLVFRHMAVPGVGGRGSGEVSGHYHPKASISGAGRSITRPCFLTDDDRVILPAYGTYTGGLRCTSAPLADLMQPGAQALLTGARVQAIPMPRGRKNDGNR